MKFSVIIPTCNRNDMLAKCLDKLAPGFQTLPFDQYEVIVTDDGEKSTAEDLISTRYSWATWTKGPSKGPAANRNHGVKLAKGEWLVFTDDDCLPDPQWLRAYKDAILKYRSVKVFEGKTYANSAKRSYSEFAPINLNGNRLFSCNLCIHSEIYSNLEGYDESFSFSYEDMEFGHRLKINNLKHEFIVNASVCHPWRTSNMKSWKSYLNQSAGIAVLIKKYPDLLSKYNSIFFLKELPVSLARDFIPKLYRYRFRGGFVIIMHSLFHLYMVYKLFIPTVNQLIKNKT